MRNITKKILAILSLGLLNLNAEKITIDRASVEQFLNTYYDICERNYKEGRDGYEKNHESSWRCRRRTINL